MDIETLSTEEMILEDLLAAVCRTYGLKIHEAVPIRRGWLNLKWKIVTDSGTFLLKQYNKKRFRLYKTEELTFAFSQQQRLHEQGLPCPHVLSHQGSVLLESEKGELFIVMEFSQGKLIPPGKSNVQQIYDLGRATGNMHRVLNDGTLGVKSSTQFIPPSRETRLAHWKTVWEETGQAGKVQLLPGIEAQLKATEEMEMECLHRLQPGWAHRDLWVDNLLFEDHRLTAILDFDRLKYDYPQLDAARAVISCALDDQLDVTLAAAFMEGYREEHAACEGYLTHSLHLLWYMESTWWIHKDMDEHSIPPARFSKEMNWLAEHHKQIAELLGNI